MINNKLKISDNYSLVTFYTTGNSSIQSDIVVEDIKDVIRRIKNREPIILDLPFCRCKHPFNNL